MRPRRAGSLPFAAQSGQTGLHEHSDLPRVRRAALLQNGRQERRVDACGRRGRGAEAAMLPVVERQESPVSEPERPVLEDYGPAGVLGLPGPHKLAHEP